jgi:hypothetical protein
MHAEMLGMEPGRRLALVLFALVAACASATRMEAPIHLDFSLGGPDDLAMPTNEEMSVQPPDDLGVAPSRDLAATSADFARTADLGAASSQDMTQAAPACLDLGGTTAPLYVAGVANGNNLYVARFTSASGWQQVTVPSGTSVAEVAIDAIAGGNPIVVSRQTNNNVAATVYDACAGTFSSLAQISASATTLNRPAVVGGSSADVVFRGAVSGDQRLYHSQYQNSMFTTPTTQSNFLTTLAQALVRYDGALHVIHAGTDTRLYDGTISDGAGGGTAILIPSPTPSPTPATNLSPAAAVDSNGTLYVVWTSTDTNLWWTFRPAAGAYAKPKQFCDGAVGPCLIDSKRAPAIAIASDGTPIATWTGNDDDRVYTSTLQSGVWSTPLLASGPSGTPETTMLVPAISGGIDTATAELVYVRDGDGLPRHVRLIGGTWSAPTSVTTTNFLATPALAIAR